MPRIVLIEPNQTMRQELGKVLEGIYGLEVVPATNAEGALRSLSEQRMDLVLASLGPGESSDVDVIGRLRAANPCPIVCVADADSVQLRAAGCDDVLERPYLLEELGQVLSRWLPADDLGQAIQAG